MRNIITASRLIPIPKEGEKLRPITIGEAILKIAESYLESLLQDTIEEEFADLQYAFKSCGTETIIHEIRSKMAEDPTLRAVFLDAQNAFNCLSRDAIFEAVFSDQRMRPIWNIVHMCYARPTQLLSPLLDAPLTSEEGTRQGSILAGFLFCLVLQKKLRPIKERFPSVDIFAFMDDISTLGEGRELEQALVELNKAMLEIGLKFNLKKSTAIEPTPALSREFGFTHAPTGARLLGGFIGEDDSHKKWIESLRAHNVAFFEKIRKMEPDVAFAILSKCGIPKWNHLCRVTPPHIMNELCDSFDDMAIFAFESIARLPKDGMTSESRLALHLPTAFGGLGVTQYKRISKALYDASSQGNLAPQRALTK